MLGAAPHSCTNGAESDAAWMYFTPVPLAEFTVSESPFSHRFTVLLRRQDGEPFGLYPSKSALCHGSLRLRAGGPGHIVGEGDYVVRVNAFASGSEGGPRALKQLREELQVVLEVERLRPPEFLSYAWMVPAAYLFFNPAKLSSVAGLLEKHIGREKELFLQICSKYASQSEDWEDVLQILAMAQGAAAHVSCKRGLFGAGSSRNAALIAKALTPYCGKLMGLQGSCGFSQRVLCLLVCHGYRYRSRCRGGCGYYDSYYDEDDDYYY
eukprot:s2023_g1.t1